MQPSWINFASTAKAKAKIQGILRRNLRELQKDGEETLKAFLQKNGMELSTANVNKLCLFHEKKTPEKLYLAIGEKNVILTEKDIDCLLENKSQGGSKWKKYVPFLKSDKKKSAEAESKEETGTGTLITVGKDFNKKKPVYVTEDNITGYVFPTCCHAIPGDDILGFIDNDGHIDIHLRQCQVANKLKSSYGNRIVDAKWDMHKTLYFDARIQIRGIDRIGMLLDVTNVITTQMNVNIRKIVISCNDGIFDGIIDMGVHDRDDVKLIMENLRDIRGLQEILSVDME